MKEAEEEIVKLMGNDMYARARMMAEGLSRYDYATNLVKLLEQVQAGSLLIKELGLLPYLEYGSIYEYLLSKENPLGWRLAKPPGSHSEIAFMIDYSDPNTGSQWLSQKIDPWYC